MLIKIAFSQMISGNDKNNQGSCNDVGMILSQLSLSLIDILNELSKSVEHSRLPFQFLIRN